MESPSPCKAGFMHATNYHTCITNYSGQEENFNQNPVHILQNEDSWKEALPLTKAVAGFKEI